MIQPLRYRHALSLALLLATGVPLALAARTPQVRTGFAAAAHLPTQGAEPADAAIEAAIASAAPARGAVSRAARAGAPPAVTGSLRIEPAGGTAYLNRPQTFTIWNTGSTAATYTLAATCEGAAQGCAASASSVTIGPSASAQVTVTFTVGGTGVVRLTATSSAESASGWIDVQPLSSTYGSYHARGRCVTVALPGQAASECGDLRLAHALPAVRTMNRARAPVLLYNSGLAQPRFRMVVVVAPNAAKASPDSVALTATLANGRSLGRQSWYRWPAGSWTPGESRRLVYSVDTPDLPTGLYRVTLESIAWRSGVPGVATTTVDIPFVNRSASRFGAGWWVAGVDEITHLADGRKLWVSGDGSVLVYLPLNDSTWMAWNPERPDTLKKRLNAQGATRYVRLLPGGARVVFGATGTQDSTVDRTGQATSFAYGANGLSTITVPGGAVYTFEYASGTRPRLARVRLDRDTARRTVEIGNPDGDPRIRSIQDPDGALTSFDYASPTDTAQKRITRRMDPRRLTWSMYAYDATGKVTQGQLDMGAAGETDDIVVRIAPAESRGAVPAPALFDSAYTRVDGPRPDGDARDVTRFWIAPGFDRGIPLRIVDALGNETVLTYGDARFETLVTRVDGPVLGDGARQVSTATYDARGNLSATVTVNPLGDGRDATTRYERTDAGWPDFVTRVTAATGETVDLGYDPAGNRQWQQPGASTAQRTWFSYVPQTSLVATVTSPAATGQPANPVERFEYDGQGNLDAIVSPKGYRTVITNDALGRVLRTTSPIDTASTAFRTDSTVYDAADRVLETISRSPATGLSSSPAIQELRVTTTYDAVGLPLSVTRSMSPDSNGIGAMTISYRYDAAGRRVAQVNPDGRADSTAYDAAGNAVYYRSRRVNRVGTITFPVDPVRMTYDAGNRLTQRITPELYYAAYTTTGASRTWSYPYKPLNPDDPSHPTRISGDTATFTYDAAGRMLTADNHDARINRSYYPGGLLRGDTLRIRTYGGSDFTLHAYGMEHRYDLGGRQTVLRNPGQLAAAPGQDSVVYTYETETGDLATVVDPAGNAFGYQYDAAGYLTTRTIPGQITETLSYDLEGRLASQLIRSANPAIGYQGQLVAAGLAYDARNKVLMGANGQSSYDGMGALSRWTAIYDNDDREDTRTTLDPLGNVRSETRNYIDSSNEGRPTNTVTTYSYAASTGRQTAMSVVPTGTSGVPTTQAAWSYDESGNRYWQYRGDVVSGQNATVQEGTYSYYDAADRLRVVDRQRCLTASGACAAWNEGLQLETSAFEEYRYDALGRRVLVRRQLYEINGTCSSYYRACASSIERLVWDGDQLQWEIRAPGADWDYKEDDAATGEYDGRVGYTHGLGIDAPLSLQRIGHTAGTMTVIPHANWRGIFETVTFSNGTLQFCQSGCVNAYDIPFTGLNVNGFLEPLHSHTPRHWFGSLLTSQRDASGLLYRRNRMYDPRTGRFTQEDPIGLAGGF
ncbi:MAG TPA: hypothetical protein VFJ82_25505, partial [Longimicrobium sp.]|nr:hypothetical protein [Longimicrobium sp.]